MGPASCSPMVPEVTLVCQSMGGWTGMRMVTESPERVRALVMNHTPGSITNDEIRAVQQRLTANRTPVTAPFGSWAVAPDYQDKYVAGAIVKVLGNAGHSSYFESPALFNKTVEEFIADHLN